MNMKIVFPESELSQDHIDLSEEVQELSDSTVTTFEKRFPFMQFQVSLFDCMDQF